MAMKPIKVSQLNSYIKRIIQTDPLLGNVTVIGEISNLKYHSSGHVYFTLKDETSRLSCFLSQEQALNLHYELAEGMEITASGYVSVYERNGSYSLYVGMIEIAGTGNLAIAFEQLKARLLKEGLFDEKYKKPIPLHPEKIILITSDTGAVVRDMIKIITERNDQVDIIVYPCIVQGPSAARDIAEAIQGSNRKFPEADAILLGRGGGSMEELWPFNEEVVARSIFLSEIPIISAVGHETDITIADFVADKRAATPSEAARIAVPETMILRKRLDETFKQIHLLMRQRMELADLKIQYHDISRLRRQALDRIEFGELRCRNFLGMLESYNPYSIMTRGYAAILDREDHLAASIASFQVGDSLTVIFKDGKIRCCVEEIRRNENGADK